MKKTAQGLKTTDIKGKDYVEVPQRVTYFRREFPEYRIVTNWIKVDSDEAICQVNILDKDNNICSSGTAMELKGNGFINKTSHVENCETSAVGRALGFMGIGIDTSIASYEEVQNAIKTQNMKAEKADEEGKKSLEPLVMAKLNATNAVKKALTKKYISPQAKDAYIKKIDEAKTEEEYNFICEVMEATQLFANGKDNMKPDIKQDFIAKIKGVTQLGIDDLLTDLALYQ